MGVTVSAVVPTLGRSPWLLPCLEALHREGVEVIVVDQGEAAVELPAGLADRVLRPGKNLGFTGGTNLGIAAISATSAELVATVNDDVLVEPGWAATLSAALESDPRIGAVQGVTLMMDDPARADGCGIEWNRWWQAVQVGHGLPAPASSEPVREIFGVSATVAVYRRAALRAVSLDDGSVFDPRLISYYEDVELAGRLRAAGWSALLVPAARARHAGSATGGTMSRERWRLIYGNRWLAASRLLGRGFWPRVPVMLLRDVLDLARAAGCGDRARASGITAGWGRAIRFR